MQLFSQASVAPERSSSSFVFSTVVTPSRPSPPVPAPVRGPGDRVARGQVTCTCSGRCRRASRPSAAPRRGSSPSVSPPRTARPDMTTPGAARRHGRDGTVVPIARRRRARGSFQGGVTAIPDVHVNVMRRTARADRTTTSSHGPHRAPRPQRRPGERAMSPDGPRPPGPTPAARQYPLVVGARPGRDARQITVWWRRAGPPLHGDSTYVLFRTIPERRGAGDVESMAFSFFCDSRAGTSPGQCAAGRLDDRP